MNKNVTILCFLTLKSPKHKIKYFIKKCKLSNFSTFLLRISNLGSYLLYKNIVCDFVYKSIKCTKLFWFCHLSLSLSLLSSVSVSLSFSFFFYHSQKVFRFQIRINKFQLFPKIFLIIKLILILCLLFGIHSKSCFFN